MGKNNLNINRIDLLEELLVRSLREQERDFKLDYYAVHDSSQPAGERPRRWWCKYCGKQLPSAYHSCACMGADGQREVHYLGQIGYEQGMVRLLWQGQGCVIEVTGLSNGEPSKRTFVISIDEIDNLNPTERSE